MVAVNSNPEGAGSRVDARKSGSKLASLGQTPKPTPPRDSQAGDRLKVRPETTVVKRFDTLTGIAARFGVSLGDLQKLNPTLFAAGVDASGKARTAGGHLIYPGDVVRIKASQKESTVATAFAAVKAQKSPTPIGAASRVADGLLTGGDEMLKRLASYGKLEVGQINAALSDPLIAAQINEIFAVSKPVLGTPQPIAVENPEAELPPKVASLPESPAQAKQPAATMAPKNDLPYLPGKRGNPNIPAIKPLIVPTVPQLVEVTGNDTIETMMQRHGVSRSDLKRWNPQLFISGKDAANRERSPFGRKLYPGDVIRVSP